MILRGVFLRMYSRQPIVGAAIGLGPSGVREIAGWTTTDEAGRFAFSVNTAGPWTLRTRVGGSMQYVPVGYLDRGERAVDLIVDRGLVAAFDPGTLRRVRVA